MIMASDGARRGDVLRNTWWDDLMEDMKVWFVRKGFTD